MIREQPLPPRYKDNTLHTATDTLLCKYNIQNLIVDLLWILLLTLTYEKVSHIIVLSHFLFIFEANYVENFLTGYNLKIIVFFFFLSSEHRGREGKIFGSHIFKNLDLGFVFTFYP